MHLTLAVTGSDTVVQAEVGARSQVDDVKAVASVELGVAPDRLEVSYAGEALPDEALLSDVGVEDNDLMEVRILADGAPGGAQLEQLQLGEGQQQQQQQESGGGVRGLLRRGLSRMSMPRMSRQDLMEQAYIEAQIATQNVNDNMALAMEESPEAFTNVIMLYIDTEVNNVPVKTFVDSGAQKTVMSRSCAERCNIMRLVDPRFGGIAVGVGQARILGRVHIAPIKIGSQIYNCSFTVLDGDQDVELLLGLDMLRKHQAMIDLRNDCLHIGEPEELIPFLSESELPEHARNRH